MIQKMNAVIATRLEDVADILEAQQANPYRVQAYRRAAMTVRNCDCTMDEIVKEEGVEGLQNLPGIGESLSRTIHQLVTSGRLPMLERLRGESHPVEVLASVPDVGKRLAERLYNDLGIGTLEELEAAVAEGYRRDSERRALIYPASRVHSQCARYRKLGEAKARNAQPRGNPPLKRKCVR
jgi:DNA polymerase (family X)